MPESAHLLIVDDDEWICRLLSRYLQREGFSVDTAADGTNMWQQLKKRQPDLIILDLMLPGVDGITLARELRTKTDTRILILTGKNNPVATIVGLEVGADDFVTKPVENGVLLARIRNVLRHTPKRSIDAGGGEQYHDTGVVKFNGWKLSPDEYELVSPAGEIVHLANNEFKLLVFLVQNTRQVLSRHQIQQQLSKRDWLPDDRSVDVSIAKLRKVIEKNPAQSKLIRTVHGVGYQFIGKVEKA